MQSGLAVAGPSQPADSAGLRFVGHPLVDVGVATLTVLAERATPVEVTFADLDLATDQIAGWYSANKALRNFLAGVVFPNSGYVQPAFTEERRREYAASILRAYRRSPLAKSCRFCGRPAVHVADRSHIPMLTGADIVNFGAKGRPGLQVCGLCLVAIQALPIGCQRSGGRLLVVESDSTELVLRLVRRNVAANRSSFALSGLEKLPGGGFHRTRIVEALVEVLAEGRLGRVGTLTVYWLTNAGQSADVEILSIPSAIVEFLGLAFTLPEYREPWRRAVSLGWETPKSMPKKAAPSAEAVTEPGRNRLFELLFRMPERANEFLRRYLRPVKSWALIELFLRKVVGMNQGQIASIREMGDRLSQYVSDYDKMSFYYEFQRSRGYADLVEALVRASTDSYKRSGRMLTSFDGFVQAFESAIDEKTSWRLVRNLIALRMVERFADSGISVEHDEDTAVPDDDEAE